ncbi:hypothetical protein MKY91_17355 [Alkalicoccobacillus gibsonii]|uniref:Tetratricopeptide repeat protein n=1 Tax=Alkalicoccobacillus gibsonii TaxID=79881 RepID=A0ABU9VM14_9BACI
MTDVDQLLTNAVSLKRQGKFEEAKQCYIDILEDNPHDLMSYVGLGKIAHLLNEQGLAIKCYLSAAHLQIAPVKRAIEENSLPLPLKLQYDQIPANVLKQLPHESAFIILIDANTPRHLAHSLIDLSEDLLAEKPGIKMYSEIYRAHILGDGSYQSTLTKWQTTQDHQIEMDEKFYLLEGRDFLIKYLNWGQLDSMDVLSLYFR